MRVGGAVSGFCVKRDRGALIVRDLFYLKNRSCEP